MVVINIISNFFFIVRLFLSVVLNIFMTLNNLLLYHFHFAVMNPIVITGYLSGIEPLSGTNFKKWKEQIGIVI